MTFKCIRVHLVLLCSAASALSRAQWTETELNPATSDGSVAYAASGGLQGGFAHLNGVGYEAGIWSGTANSWVSITPGGSTDSEVLAISGTQEAGYASVNREHDAGIWSGTAASFVDLNPAGSGGSTALATSGNQQVGFSSVGQTNLYVASLWSGTAASWVNLNPDGYIFSKAFGTNGTQQVGSALNLNAGFEALLWSGTANSFVSLSPAGAGIADAAVAISGNQEVGHVQFTYGTGNPQASLWSGSAASWVDLNPAGATDSEALATDGSLQVGWSNFGTLSSGDTQAGIWNGTTGSWTALPSHGLFSEATGITTFGGMTYISGYDYGALLGGSYYGGAAEAVVWSEPTPVPEPGPVVVVGFGMGVFGLRRRIG